MQKLINVLALASFAVSASVVGVGAHIYMNRESIAESIKGRLMEEIGVSQLGQTLLGGPALPETPEVPAGGGFPVPSVPSIGF